MTSRAFQSAPAQRNFLRFVIERTLQGRQNLKEYCIAMDVFGRDESFDQRRDSIVRIEARRLRANLAKYYEGEGQNDPVRIEIPKGGYVPVFHFECGPPLPAPSETMTIRSLKQSPWLPSRLSSYYQRLAAILAIVALAGICWKFGPAVNFAASAARITRADRTWTPDESPAYEDFLKGRFFLAKHTRGAIPQAIRSFQRAISAKPDFGPAYAGLAESYTMLPVFCGTPLHEVLPVIRVAANQAIGFNGAVAQAHVALARAADLEFDRNTAEAEFRKALQAGSNDASTRRWYARHLLEVGQLERAVDQYAVASHLDPVSAEIAQAAALPFYLQRRYEMAVAQYQKALALDANWGTAHQGLGLTYLAMGRYEDGLAESKIAYNLMDSDLVSTGQLGYAYALAGETAMARHVLSELIGRRDRGAFPIAQIYIGLGDRNAAFELLQKAYEVRDSNIRVMADPIYDTLRADARFATFSVLVHARSLTDYSTPLMRLALLRVPYRTHWGY